MSNKDKNSEIDRTTEEYKEQRREYSRKYYETHRAEANERKRKKRHEMLATEEGREALHSKWRNYYHQNRERRKKDLRESYARHAEERKLAHYRYVEEHRDEINARRRELRRLKKEAENS